MNISFGKSWKVNRTQPTISQNKISKLSNKSRINSSLGNKRSKISKEQFLRDPNSIMNRILVEPQPRRYETTKPSISVFWKKGKLQKKFILFFHRVRMVGEDWWGFGPTLFFNWATHITSFCSSCTFDYTHLNRKK